MLASYVIWTGFLLVTETGASATSNTKGQEDHQSNIENEIGKLKMKLDEVVMENIILSESYGKLVKAIMVCTYKNTTIKIKNLQNDIS